MSKRPRDEDADATPSAGAGGGAAGGATGVGGLAGADGKRARTAPSTALVAVDTSAALIAKVKDPNARTSGLMAPSMLLEGHEDSIYAAEFDPTGVNLASASKDKNIFLWRVYGECNNYMMIKGHKNAVLDIHWSTDSTMLFTASADKTAAAWDAEYGRRIKNLRGHEGIVNACSPARRGPTLVATASDDTNVKIWDVRDKRVSYTLPHDYPMTSVAFSDDGSQVFTGGVDNTIYCWDFRKDAIVYELEGHKDTISYLSVSPDGTHLLSNGMDNTVRAWDIRPFCATMRQQKVFIGATNNFEKLLLGCAWSPSGDRVAAGSADKQMYIWDFESSVVQYQLPGHKGTVTSVGFHPKEPIVCSASADKTMYVGEISSV